MAKCPECGAEHGIGAEMQRMYAERHGTVVAAGDQVVAPGSEWWRERPARAPGLRSDVGVNLGLAVGSFALIAVGSVILAVVSGEWDGLRYGIALAVVIGLVTWFWLLIDGRGLLRETERVVPGPGVVADNGGDVVVRRRLKTEIADNGRTMVDHIESLEEDQLVLVGRRLMSGSPFSRRNLCPSCFPDELYGGVRREMLDRGFLRSLGGGVNSRVELTGKGKALFGELAR